MTPERPLRALIVDDEQLARERLEGMLSEVPEVVVVDRAEDGSSAVKAIVDRRPDLVFLDVQMPGLSGFDVIRCTRSAHRPIIVFVTAFDQHAIQAFDVHAADYLLKPVSRARLQEAVRRVVERARGAAASESHARIDKILEGVRDAPSSLTIPVRDDTGTRLIRADDIRWIEADADHATLHGDGVTYSVRETLADLEERLRASRFVRVHRSAIVNAAAVRSIEPIAKGDYFLVLVDGTRIRSSRHYRAAVQALLE